MEQTIKSDVLRDWIEKLREAFDRTMLYKNFVEGLAVEALEEYIIEHPEDRERAQTIREPIKQLVAQAQVVNKLLIDIDQKIGRSASAEKASLEAGEEGAAAPEEMPAVPVPEPGTEGAEAEGAEAEVGEGEAAAGEGEAEEETEA
jgi:hypothetical protein